MFFLFLGVFPSPRTRNDQSSTNGWQGQNHHHWTTCISSKQTTKSSASCLGRHRNSDDNSRRWGVHRCCTTTGSSPSKILESKTIYNFYGNSKPTFLLRGGEKRIQKKERRRLPVMSMAFNKEEREREREKKEFHGSILPKINASNFPYRWHLLDSSRNKTTFRHIRHQIMR